jgi:hypothetical protein
MPKTPSVDTLQQELLLPVAVKPDYRLVRIEKNLNSLGFFSPLVRGSIKRREKNVTMVKILPDGARAEARATIIAPRKLPDTSDLDKYLAFQFIVAEIKKRSGQVANPIAFTTYQLLRILGLKPVGKRYLEVAEWLRKMSGTQIESQGAVYFAKGKRYVNANFHVFDTTVTAGEELPDGRIAEQNYVWLSTWQLENLNSNYVLPIDLTNYRKLSAPIAKALVPIIYVWFHATKRPIQKRYGELCQLLSISPQKVVSKIRDRLDPAMLQLQSAGYISSWDVVRTVDGSDWKVILSAGALFRQVDRDNLADSKFHDNLKTLTARGVEEKTARRLLLDVDEEYDVREVIEWVDSIVLQNQNLKNPPGMYVSFIRDAVRPPKHFLSSHKAMELKCAQSARDLQRIGVQQREIEYANYREEQIRLYLDHLNPGMKEALFARISKQIKEKYPFMSEAQISDIVDSWMFKEVEPEVNLATFEEFATRQPEQITLVSARGR